MLGTFTKCFLLSFLIEVTQTYIPSFSTQKKEPLNQGILKLLVEATGFEPATSASRTQRSTKLSHTSLFRCLNLLCRSTQDILYYRVSELSTGFLKKFKKIFCWDISDCIVCFVCIIRTTRNML